MALVASFYGLTWAGVESQVGNVSLSPLKLSQQHSTHGPALLGRELSLGPAPAPQVDGSLHVALRCYRRERKKVIL